MSEENKIVFVKRLKSLLWRAGMMTSALAVDFVLENLGLFALPQSAIVILGLVLGEVSKHLNTKK